MGTSCGARRGQVAGDNTIPYEINRICAWGERGQATYSRNGWQVTSKGAS